MTLCAEEARKTLKLRASTIFDIFRQRKGILSNGLNNERLLKEFSHSGTEHIDYHDHPVFIHDLYHRPCKI